MAEKPTVERKTEEIKGDNESNIRLADKFPPEKFNLLYPSDTQIKLSKLQKAIFEVVKINPDPQRSEVYDVGSIEIQTGQKKEWKKKLALSKVAKDMLAACASIMPVPQGTHRIYTPDPNEISYQAAAVLIKLDGQPMPSVRTKTVDIKLLEEEIKIKLERMAHDGKLFKEIWENDKKKKVYFKYGTPECKEELEYQIKIKTFEAKKFIREKVESGAFGRCVAHLLGLKSWYLAEELAKPFVIVRIVRNDDFLLEDPEGRKMLMQEAVSGSKSLFGFSMPTQKQLVGRIDETTSGEAQSPDNEEESEMEVETVASEVVNEHDDHPESEPRAGEQLGITLDDQKK
jgi:hypothetical protein